MRKVYVALTDGQPIELHLPDNATSGDVKAALQLQLSWKNNDRNFHPRGDDDLVNGFIDGVTGDGVRPESAFQLQTNSRKPC